MSEETTGQKLRPFHETIVDAIAQAQCLHTFALLAELIMKTRIPAGHAEIRKAWAEAWKGPGVFSHPEDIQNIIREGELRESVIRGLQEQEAEAAKKAEEKEAAKSAGGGVTTNSG